MNEKEQWIINYITNKSEFKQIDVLDFNFIYDYSEQFNTDISGGLNYPKCKELSKILSLMYRKGLLKRYSNGVKGGWNQDNTDNKAPKWVYSYIVN